MITLECKSCKRYLGEVEMFVGEIICSNTSCKAGNQIKIISNSPDQYIAYTFKTAPKPSKKDLNKDEPS